MNDTFSEKNTTSLLKFLGMECGATIKMSGEWSLKNHEGDTMSSLGIGGFTNT